MAKTFCADICAKFKLKEAKPPLEASPLKIASKNPKSGEYPKLLRQFVQLRPRHRPNRAIARLARFSNAVFHLEFLHRLASQRAVIIRLITWRTGATGANLRIRRRI